MEGKAVEAYQAVLKLNPNYAAAYYKLGRLYFRARKFHQAKTAYLRTVELDPKQGAVHAGLGAIYYLQNRVDDAFSEYQLALKLDANLAIAHAGLAAIYHRRNRLQEAIAEYQAALKLDSKAHYAMNGIARIYVQQNTQLQGATAFAKKAFGLTPNPQYLETLALAYSKTGEHEHARKAIRAAIEMDAKNSSFRKTLAQINNRANADY